MAPRLNEEQKSILFWLWMMPWASAKNLSLVTGFSASRVNRCLKDHPQWVGRHKVGMVETAVFRYFFLPAGLEDLTEAFGWQIQWWHTVRGLTWLLYRLQVLECCYRIMPRLWDSCLVRDEELAFRSDLPWDMVRVNPGQAVLQELRWFHDSQIPLVGRYWVEDLGVDVYVPVAVFGPYRRPSEVGAWPQRVGRILARPETWDSDHRATPRFPVVIVAGDEALGVKVRLVEGLSRWANAGIVDLHGNVVDVMHRHVPVWDGFDTEPTRARSLGDPEDLNRLVTQTYWSVLLARQGRELLYWVHDFPNTTQEQAYGGCGIGERLLGKMMASLAGFGLLMQEADGFYPGLQGLIALADIEGCHVNRVRARWQHLLENEQHRLAHAVHSRKAAELAVRGIAHGVDAYSGLHAFYDFQGFTQIKPDVLYKLRLVGLGAGRQRRGRMPRELVEHMDAGRDLAMLLVVEAEQRAGVRADAGEKVEPFFKMKLAGSDLYGAFIADSEIAAERLLVASHDLPVWVTTWDRMNADGFEDCWRISCPAESGHWAMPVVPVADAVLDTPFYPTGLAVDEPLLWLFRDLKVL